MVELDEEGVRRNDERPGHDLSPAFALDEYKETLAFLRHDDQQAWTILGLSGTVTLALWAFALKDSPVWSAKAVATAGLGVLALTLGRLMARRVTAYTQSRKVRADELERTLGFELVSKMRDRMPKTRVPGINLMLDMVVVAAIVGWAAYLVAFVVRTR